MLINRCALSVAAVIALSGAVAQCQSSSKTLCDYVSNTEISSIIGFEVIAARPQNDASSIKRGSDFSCQIIFTGYAKTVQLDVRSYDPKTDAAGTTRYVQSLVGDKSEPVDGFGGVAFISSSSMKVDLAAQTSAKLLLQINANNFIGPNLKPLPDFQAKVIKLAKYLATVVAPIGS